MSDRVAAIQYASQADRIANRPQRDGDSALAYGLQSSAVVADSTLATGWYTLGAANTDMRCIPAAIAAYRRALELPDSDVPGGMNTRLRVQALTNLSQQLMNNGNLHEALAAVEKALRLDPDSDYAWCNKGLILRIFDLHEDAIEAARRAVDLNRTPVAETALALVLLNAGHYAEGLKAFEARFAYKLRHFLDYPMPQWHGAAGKHVFLVADQGIGDTLSFARFLPRAAQRCLRITAQVHPELLRLFQATFAYLPNVEFMPIPNPLPVADCWTAFVSLPTALGLTDEEIRDAPELAVPVIEAVPTWKDQNRRFHIGVAWAGSPKNDIDKWRSFDVTWLLELYRVPGVQLYSLQVGDRARELHDAGCGALIRDLSPFIRDVADTMGIMRDLDMVVTVESALGHIAGAVGKECWVPYSYAGRDYRAESNGGKPLWYPNHRFYKQMPNGQWGPVFEKIVSDLRRKVEAMS